MDTPKLFVLGPKGTHTHAVGELWLSENHFPKRKKPQIELVQSDSDLLPALDKAPRGSYAVTPIENTMGGFVREVIHSWLEIEKKLDPEDVSAFRPRIIQEVSIPIAHQLLVQPSINSIDEIETVYSHPQALMQCRKNLGYLDLWKKRATTSSTAEAALIVAESDLMHRNRAALASSFAAEIYGLKVLKRHLQDSQNNSTRFHIITKTALSSLDMSRTAVLCWADNSPGSLAHILQCISRYGANVPSLDPTPLGANKEKYVFYIEFDVAENIMWSNEKILSELRQNSKKLFVLGSFAREF